MDLTINNLNDNEIKSLVEAVIFSSDKPISVEKIKQTALQESKITNKRLNEIIKSLQEDYENRGVQLVKLASGYRFQASASLGHLLGKMWEEKPAKYSRALLETLALIAYKQPITRGEIEDVRGVSVSSNIVRTLLERNWIKAVGHKDVPGRPSLFGTTNEFLDYFNLKSLNQLPQLIEPESLDDIARKLESEFMGEDLSTPAEQTN